MHRAPSTIDVTHTTSSSHPKSQLHESQLHESLNPGRLKRIQFSRLILTAAAIVFALVLIGFLFAGKSGAEKTIIRLLQPIGAGWICLTAWCIQHTLLNGLRRSMMPWLVWIAIVLLTTSPFAAWCLHRLESSVESYQPERDGKLAAVVVLGGGTRQGPTRAEMASAGDRVLYAAQLYHQGLTPRLITTGDATPGISRDTSSPREHTLEIWNKLNIPLEAIGSLQGQNTFQEMQSLKKIFDQFNGGRVGVLTSALHLPRAMRLAQSLGLEVVPLAANHESSDDPFAFLDFIPSAGPLNQLAACQHEFMAWFVGR